MPPEVRKYYKPRIGNITALLLLTFTVLCWVVMLLLSLLVATEVVSWFIGAAQDIILTVWLWWLGAYSVKKNQVQKFLVTAIPIVIELVPFVNDIPAAIIEVAAIVFIVRMEDIAKAKEKAAAAKAVAEKQAEDDARYAASQAAQVRAQAQRQQAMQKSLEELKKNPPTAANDNTSQHSLPAAA